MEYHNQWPTHTMVIVNGIASSKSESDWDEVDKRLVQLNTKAVNVLYYVLDANEFNNIFIGNSIKEI